MEEAVSESEGDGAAPSRGYSIWSLLVLTTLIAVVLAIPRRIVSGRVLYSFFILSHQLSLWLLVGTLVWMLLGKQRIVLVIESIVVVLVWGPLFASAVEGLVRGNGSHHLVHKVLARFGLYDDYSLLYRSIFETFGYSFQ